MLSLRYTSVLERLTLHTCHVCMLAHRLTRCRGRDHDVQLTWFDGELAEVLRSSHLPLGQGTSSRRSQQGGNIHSPLLGGHQRGGDKWGLPPTVPLANGRSHRSVGGRVGGGRGFGMDTDWHSLLRFLDGFALDGRLRWVLIFIRTLQ